MHDMIVRPYKAIGCIGLAVLFMALWPTDLQGQNQVMPDTVAQQPGQTKEWPTADLARWVPGSQGTHRPIVKPAGKGKPFTVNNPMYKVRWGQKGFPTHGLDSVVQPVMTSTVRWPKAGHRAGKGISAQRPEKYPVLPVQVPDTQAVVHGDTLYPPKRVPAIMPAAKAALPLQFKDDAVVDLTYLDVQQGLAASYVHTSLIDRRGILWIGTSSGLVSYNGHEFRHYTTEHGLSHNYIRAIHEDDRGHLWLATWGGGLVNYDGQMFTHYTTRQGLSGNFTAAITEDHRGNLWVGTQQGGVNRFDGDTFTHYTTRQGLASDYVLAVAEDDTGAIWLGTFGGGLARLTENGVVNVTTTH